MVNSGIFFILILIFSAAITFLSIKIYLCIPSGWLCDFLEQPQDKHLRKNRITGKGNFVAAIAVGTSTLFSSILIRWWCLFSAALPSSSEAALIWKIVEILKTDIFLIFAFIPLYIAALSDIRYMVIPDQSCLFVFFVGAVKALCCEDGAVLGLWRMGGGLVLAGGLVMAAALIALIFYGTGAMGAGDVKLLATCGAVVGGYGACGIYCISALGSGIYFALGMIFGTFKADVAKPMAPWIFMATILVIAVSPY